MSHGLWRNLITVLLYKARPLTVNADADSVITTAAPSDSELFCAVHSSLKERICASQPVVCFWTCSMHRQRFVKIFPVNTSSTRKTLKRGLYFNSHFLQKLVGKITNKQKKISSRLSVRDSVVFLPSSFEIAIRRRDMRHRSDLGMQI